MDSPARRQTSPPTSPLSDLSHTPSPSSPCSPLSVLSKSPSLSPAAAATAANMDVTARYPSPSSTATQSGSASPLKLPDSQEIQVRTDGAPPPSKRRRLAAPKPRTTDHLDLDNRDDAAEANLERLLNILRRKKKIVVIAGAGISVSAGSKSPLSALVRDRLPNIRANCLLSTRLPIQRGPLQDPR